MAEIKSTLDLVMERTKHMVQSDEEKEKRQVEELEQKVRGWVLALIEQRMSGPQLAETLEKLDQGERQEARRALAKELAGSLSLDGQSAPIIEGLEAVGGEAAADLLRETEDLIKEYGWKLDELRAEADEKLQKVLAEAGISGPAVRPKREHSPDFVAAADKLRLDLTARLDWARSALLERI